MKQPYILLAFATLALMNACGKTSKTKEQTRVPKTYTIEQLYNNQTLSGADFNSDETKLLTQNNKSGIFNIYELNISDTTSITLTHSTKESFFAVNYLPNSNKFIYRADEGGNENTHLYLSAIGDTTAKDITPWPNTANSFVDWNEDKTAMYISSNKRNPKYFDILKLDIATWKATMIFENKEGLEIDAMSKSGRYFALTKPITTSQNELYLFDATNKKTTKISNDSEASWSVAAFEKNDSILYYTTNDGNEFNILNKYYINSGKSELLFQDKWDVSGMTLGNGEKYHTITINEDGKNKVLLFDHATNKQIELPEIKDGDVLGVTISPSEKNLMLTVGSSTSPTNLYVYNIEKKDLKRVTNSLNKDIDENDLVKAEVVRFKSFDGKEIPAIYYKPMTANKNNKVPAIVLVHGGPGGQSRVGFNNNTQFLVNHGYAVLAVNNRGSSGYGKTFYKMDNQDHSNGDLNDCIYGKKWLMQQDYIDSNAIGIMGQSYGGCMVLGALAFHPEEFKVGIDIYGVANWIRTLRNIPPYWESFKKALYEEMGDPNTADSVRLKNISPLFNYQKINKPLMVLQGVNDVRVLKIESDEIVEGVRKNGVPVEYVVFEDEGHGFLKKENNIIAYNKILEFLEKYLRSK